MSDTVTFRRLLKPLLLVALGLRLLTAWFDYGFVAVDDHNHVLVDATPAQEIPGPSAVIDRSGVRSPVPRLFVYGLAQSALAVGVDDPVDQIRWIYSILGALSLVSVWLVWKMYSDGGRDDWGFHAVVWTGFHFLAVFISTRALIENMAAPLVTLSGVWLVFYLWRDDAKWLAASLIALAAGSVLRLQAGICVLALFAVPVAKRAWRDLGVSAAAGIALFLLTGWLDGLLRGGFHETLQAYVAYNAQHSSSFGESSWYNYLLLLFGVSLPPLLVSRFRRFPWRDYGRSIWPMLMMIAVFVVSHSLIPHKEDRFMIPIMPLYFASLAPLSAHLFGQRPASWRAFGFAGVNGLLLLAILATPTQNNVIALVRYLSDRPDIRTLWAVRDSVQVYPVAYASRRLPERHIVSYVPAHAARTQGCSVAVAVREDLLERSRPQLGDLREVAVFEPGVLERLLVRINPSHNRRRAAVHLFQLKGCPES